PSQRPSLMNRYPLGKPPCWWSPLPSRFWMNVWRPFRRRAQRRGDRVLEIQVHGLEPVRAAMAQGHGILFAGNHPGHADSWMIYEAVDQLRTTCYVLTTWQVFAMGSRLERLQYRHHGCFSIDRDGADRQAFRQASHVLSHTSQP